MQRKIHNQTLFVAALSVYLGLLIVGAPPHVLAQQPKINEQTSLIERGEEQVKQSRKEFAAFYAQLNELLAEDSLNSVPTKFSVEVILIDGWETETRILNAAGNPSIIDFLRREAVRTDNRRESSDFRPNFQSVLQNLEIGKSDIVKETIFTFANEDVAKQFGYTIRAMVDQAVFDEYSRCEQGVLRSEKVTINPYIDGLSVRLAKNQVFIVTRLPRAGLDSLFKADEKAN